MGRLVVCRPEMVMTDEGFWSVEQGGGVSRMAHVSDGRSEVTYWVDGVEIERFIAAV
jgi:hypothetical protein